MPSTMVADHQRTKAERDPPRPTTCRQGESSRCWTASRWSCRSPAAATAPPASGRSGPRPERSSRPTISVLKNATSDTRKADHAPLCGVKADVPVRRQEAAASDEVGFPAWPVRLESLTYGDSRFHSIGLPLLVFPVRDRPDASGPTAAGGYAPSGSSRSCRTAAARWSPIPASRRPTGRRRPVCPSRATRSGCRRRWQNSAPE